MNATAQIAAPPALEPVPDGTLRWVALGDSFTAGVGGGERTWARIVHQVVSYTRPIRIDNLARVGATAADVEREQLPSAIAAEPDLLTLICGANDVIGAVRPQSDRIAGDIDRIWCRVRAELPAATLLTATYPAIAPEAVRPRTRQRIERGFAELNESVRQTAARNGVDLVELAEHPGRIDRGNYAADGIHPSAAGHRAAARVLYAAIEALLAGQPKRQEEDR